MTFESVQIFTCFCGTHYKVLAEIPDAQQRVKFICLECEREISLQGKIRTVYTEVSRDTWMEVDSSQNTFKEGS